MKDDNMNAMEERTFCKFQSKLYNYIDLSLYDKLTVIYVTYTNIDHTYKYGCTQNISQILRDSKDKIIAIFRIYPESYLFNLFKWYLKELNIDRPGDIFITNNIHTIFHIISQFTLLSHMPVAFESYRLIYNRLRNKHKTSQHKRYIFQNILTRPFTPVLETINEDIESGEPGNRSTNNIIQ